MGSGGTMAKNPIYGPGGSTRTIAVKVRHQDALPGIPKGGVSNHSGVIVRRDPVSGATSRAFVGRGFGPEAAGLTGPGGNSLSHPSAAMSGGGHYRIFNAGAR